MKIRDIPLKAKISKVGSAYVIRIPKVLVDCEYFAVGKKYKVSIEEDDD